MIYREPPKCPFCGKVIAEGVYNTNSDIIGDNFLRWEYKDHSCTPSLEWTEETKKAWHKQRNKLMK